MMRSITPTLLLVVLALGCGGAAAGGGGGGGGGGRGGFDPSDVPTQHPLTLTRETGPGGAAALRVGDALLYDFEVNTPETATSEDSASVVTTVEGAFQYRVLFDSGERWEVGCSYASLDETRHRRWIGARDQSSANCALRRGDVLSPTFALTVSAGTGANLTAARSVEGFVTPEGLPTADEARRMDIDHADAVPVLRIGGSGSAWGFTLSMRETTYSPGSHPDSRDVPVENALVGAATLGGDVALRYRDGLDASIRSLVGVAGSVLLVMGHAQPIAQPPIPVQGNGTSSSPVTAVSMADEGLCALHADGAVICRNGDEDPFHAADAGVSAIATAGDQLCLRMTDSALRCGLRVPADTLPPRVLGAEGSDSLTVSEGERMHVCMVTGGTPACFGDMRDFSITHMLGLDDWGVIPLPQQPALVEVGLIGGECDMALARNVDGGVAIIAREHCTLGGDGQITAERLATGASVVRGASDLDVGALNTCVVHSNGKVACWGEDLNWGTANSEREADAPTDVDGVRDAEELAVGFDHACARTRTGHVTCWGRNIHGQLGDGGTRTRLSARNIPGLSGVTAIDSNSAGSCAVAEGALLCWGEELGDEGEDARVPVRVAL